MDCSIHSECLKSQYCATCDELMCIQCQMEHTESKGHTGISVNDIALMTMKKIKENMKNMDVNVAIMNNWLKEDLRLQRKSKKWYL